MKKFFQAAALVAGLVAAGTASAAPTCTACNWAGGTNTYIGSMDPSITETSFVFHTVGASTFTDYWVFQISPAGNAEMSASFTPNSQISNFTVQLFSVTASGTCTVGGTCTGGVVTNGAALASDSVGPDQYVGLDPIYLSVGWYAYRVQGTSTAGNGLYSGQIATSTAVPEPASLGLVGLALLGAAAGLRRRSR